MIDKEGKNVLQINRFFQRLQTAIKTLFMNVGCASKFHAY